MIRCIAIDDSPLALGLLESYIKRVDYLEFVKGFASAVAAEQFLSTDTPDLIFLDIEMPDIQGIELLKKLKPKSKVILTTAYANYAVQGFELNVSDYLLKPFSFDRFQAAVEKVKEQLQLESDAAHAQRSIFLKSGYSTVKINVNEILYIEALKDYIQVFTAKQKILSLMSMGDILELLASDDFVRVHRSFIIALSKLTRVSGKKVHIGEKMIPIGEMYKPGFYAILKERKIIS